MILVGHQPEYIPYLGFFQKVARADHFMIVDHVQYARKDFQNRNYIRSPSGKLLLTVPVLTKNRFYQPINKVSINPSVVWARKHWRSIHFSYKDAPFFERYAEVLKEVYEKDWVMLSDLTIHLIELMLEWLDIHVPISRSSHLGISKSSTETLIEMCRKVGADAYISGQGAREYLDVALLESAGIRHHFVNFKHPVYPQLHESFMPNLSALDVLFNCGDEAVDVLRRCIQESPLEEE